MFSQGYKYPEKRGNMLVIAGILFGMAMLCLFIEKMVDNANVNLTWVVRLLLFTAMALVAAHVLTIKG